MIIPPSFLTVYYREVAIAILRCDCWKKMMKLCVTENSTGKTEATKIVTPMRMLIETMPGIYINYIHVIIHLWIQRLLLCIHMVKQLLLSIRPYVCP